MSRTDYDQFGAPYSRTRRTDPRIEAHVHAAFGDARTVVNIGAGTGGYEPRDRDVVAVEPSRVMLQQRSPDKAPAVQAVAEALPFPNASFDVAMATLTLHHWSDVGRGLSEMRRVAARQVIFMFDASWATSIWLVEEYFPAILDIPSEQRAPDTADIAQHLDVQSIAPVPVPADCVDGFAGAYWNRPEAYLDPEIQAGMSSFAQMEPVARREGTERLRADLASGAWDARHGELRARSEMDIGYRLVVAGVT